MFGKEPTIKVLIEEACYPKFTFDTPAKNTCTSDKRASHVLGNSAKNRLEQYSLVLSRFKNTAATCISLFLCLADSLFKKLNKLPEMLFRFFYSWL